MRLTQLENSDPQRKDDSANHRPWRKHAAPLNKEPSNPNYPKKSFDYEQWMKDSAGFKGRPGQTMEEGTDEVPEEGDVIRTKKMQMEGKVERIGKNNAGYDEVFFRIEDGRLMKTPLENVIIITKLADGDAEIMEDRIDEISTEVLSKYKTAAAADARSADKAGNYEQGNKRFKGIVNATKKQFANDAKKKTEEGTMGGINRCAPAQDVSYEHVLDEVKAMWEAERVDELSVNKLRDYAKKAKSAEPVHDKVKTVNHIRGYHKAEDRIASKTGDRTKR
jgi:hypothetical protein